GSSWLGPPAVARAIAVVHTCMYDAWAAYDARALGTEFGQSLRRPKWERTLANKQIAISYAAYRALADLFPNATAPYQLMVRDLGYDPSNTSVDPRTPKGVGNVACGAVLAARHRDGANQLGAMTTGGISYADYTDYLPVNPITRVPVDPRSVIDANRFQPLYYPNAGFRAMFPQPFLGAQWFKVISFGGPYGSEL